MKRFADSQLAISPAPRRRKIDRRRIDELSQAAAYIAAAIRAHALGNRKAASDFTHEAHNRIQATFLNS